jgi:hypothetical protein
MVLGKLIHVVRKDRSSDGRTLVVGDSFLDIGCWALAWKVLSMD